MLPTHLFSLFASKPSSQKAQIWISTLACITSTNTVRKSLRIRWHVGNQYQDLTRTIPDWMYRPLRRLTRVRSMTVEILLDFMNSSGLDRFGRHVMDHKFSPTTLAYRTAYIKKYLEQGLGHALITSTPDSITMRFRPQENIPKGCAACESIERCREAGFGGRKS